jgi:hypothetical protein
LAKGKAPTTMDMSNFLSICCALVKHSLARKAFTFGILIQTKYTQYLQAHSCVTYKNATVSILVSRNIRNRQHPNIVSSLPCALVSSYSNLNC